MAMNWIYSVCRWINSTSALGEVIMRSFSPVADSFEDALVFSSIINHDASSDTKKKFTSLFNDTCVAPNQNLMSRIINFLNTRHTREEPMEVKFNLTEETPRPQPAHKLSKVEERELKKIIDSMISAGIVRFSQSRDNQIYIQVYAKQDEDGTFKMGLQCQKLNSILKPYKCENMCVLEELELFMATKKKYFSMLNVKDVFYNINISEDCTKYTSFSFMGKQYEFVKLPRELKITDAHCLQCLKRVTYDLEKFVLVSTEGILIATETVDDHFNVLKELLRRLTRYKLQLDLPKCRVLYEEIEYRTFLVSKHGVKPTLSRIDAIQKLEPRSVPEMKNFVKLCNYFRKFIEHYKIIVQPLEVMIKKRTEIGIEELKAVEVLKKKLTSVPTLAFYNVDNETELHCDGSEKGYGVTLMQRQNDDQFHPVAYFSMPINRCHYANKRDLNSNKRDLKSNELEALTIIHAIERFHQELKYMDFTIFTDCKSITTDFWKNTCKDSTIQELQSKLQIYNCKVKYRARGEMEHVDTLSRCFYSENVSADETKD